MTGYHPFSTIPRPVPAKPGILALLREGVAVDDIAGRYGVTSEYVRRLARRNGMGFGAQRSMRIAAQIERVRELVAQNLTGTEISRRLGLRPSRGQQLVRQVRTEMGQHIQTRRRRSRGSASLVIPSWVKPEFRGDYKLISELDDEFAAAAWVRQEQHSQQQRAA